MSNQDRVHIAASYHCKWRYEGYPSIHTQEYNTQCHHCPYIWQKRNERPSWSPQENTPTKWVPVVRIVVSISHFQTITSTFLEILFVVSYTILHIYSLFLSPFAVPYCPLGVSLSWPILSFMFRICWGKLHAFSVTNMVGHVIASNGIGLIL